MAMVRTSLQKVVVFLHRLQRMAISSPRYQKLCKRSRFFFACMPMGDVSGALVKSPSEERAWTGDSGTGMQPGCLTSSSLSFDGVLWVISKR
ncbi:hypothetical protein EYF80_021261 [Liparis tanakae]|uniref:Uncharacterized protein n=1 Tax=Liparis tanakae TaxID=230148 RepID=A0A4Z2HRK0_9TELE|nr:hypothetical protein EYF80_021261 [Liparis tanakae]